MGVNFPSSSPRKMGQLLELLESGEIPIPAESPRQAPLYSAVQIQPREELLPATGARLVQTLNPERQNQLRRLSPTWRW